MNQQRPPDDQGIDANDARVGWWVRARRCPATAALLALCIGAFLGTLGWCTTQVEGWVDMLVQSGWRLDQCQAAFEDFGALSLARVWVDGEWWRVATTGLLHGSWLHLILNSWSLWVVGEWTEATWGSARTALLFALSSLGGCLASLAWVEAPMVVGASAGIMGMAGALLVGRIWGRGRVQRILEPVSARVLGGWLAVLVALGFFVPMIAQAGHLGGLGVGALLGLAWSGRSRPVGVTARLAIAGALLGLGFAGRQPKWRPGYQEYLGFRYLDRQEWALAARAFDQALAARPDDAQLANAVAYGLAKAGQDLERAKTLVDAALQEEPDNPDFVDTLGWIYCRQGRVEEGLAALQRASELSEHAVDEIETHLETCATARVENTME